MNIFEEGTVEMASTGFILELRSFHVKSKMMANHKGVQSSTEARPPAPINPAHILIEDYGLATFHIRVFAEATIWLQLHDVIKIDDDLGARTSDPSRTGCKAREILSTPVSVVQSAYARGTQCQHPAQHRCLVPPPLPSLPLRRRNLHPQARCSRRRTMASSIPTSQRIIDVVPHAFRVIPRWEHCETIARGSCAGPGSYAGQRHPVLWHSFGLRNGFASPDVLPFRGLRSFPSASVHDVNAQHLKRARDADRNLRLPASPLIDGTDTAMPSPSWTAAEEEGQGAEPPSLEQGICGTREYKGS
ncbi:hypothetical protein K488DRAFT_91688 [Vararia minispora EC-137]|uniref:Uncharacterized protein n=1 Tax=Vararia minispora EC-137 TaxID=1314806 RepID=A0ACB8Q5E3_9AGAM|nr:hypothetical protein K488DRAFT_91688 [Vararia minispora EC-137]